VSSGLSSSIINSCSLKRSQARSTSWRHPALHAPVLYSAVRTVYRSVLHGVRSHIASISFSSHVDNRSLSAGDGGRHPQTSRKNSSSLHNRTVQSQIQNRTLAADFLVQTAQIRTPRLSPLARIVMTGAGQDSYHSIQALALHSLSAGLLQPIACSCCSSASWMMHQLTPHSSHPQLTAQLTSHGSLLSTVNPLINLVSLTSCSALFPAPGKQRPRYKLPNDRRMLRSPN
jgi:hypothetical protein